MTFSGGERILRRLSPGDADPILVADFQAMSTAPRLSEMLSERIPGRAVFQIDPIGVLSGERRYVPLPQLAATCASEFLASGADHGRVLVIGHCSAAPLALRVAGLLAPARTVTAVLVNPTWPDDEQVTAKFAEFLTRFGPATRPAPDLNADPDLVVAAMEQVFLDELTVLTGWHRAWLAFLLAGRNDTRIGRAAGQAAVTVLTDSPATVTVPGRTTKAYLVRELPAQPVGTATRELADTVAAHITPGLRTSASRVAS